MSVVRVPVYAVVFFVVSGQADSAALTYGLQIPPEFTVTEYAGPDLANDIYTLHISAEGRLLVAGRGYVRELLDTTNDGIADRAVDLVHGLREGPMGVLLEGDTLYLVADGGLKRYQLQPGGPTISAEAELVLAVKTGGEHDAHAVRRGPDGWLYLLCGNTSGVTAKTITTATSPVTNPIAGCLLRISPNGQQVEVIAHGFRNAYDFDFNLTGDAFTYDSDNERCVGLPWFEPTRFYHIIPGGHYGWMNPQITQTWRRPPYFFDVVPPVATAGRGSPTGVCCYRHTAFPKRYHGGFFLADWTFGRILYVQPRSRGGAYTGTAEPFIQAVGDTGFAPTGLAVHPKTGDLFISTGGRGTRGAVYRISPTRQYPNAKPVHTSANTTTLHTLLAAERNATLDTERLAKLVRIYMGHADRLVRQAASRLATRLSASVRNDLLRTATTDSERLTLAFAVPTDALDIALAIVQSTTANPTDRLDAVRLLQICLGDLSDPKSIGTAFEGYSPRRTIDQETTADVASRLRLAFPTGHHELDRELSRTLAILADDDPATIEKLVATLTLNSDPIDDVHTLLVLARLPGRRDSKQTQVIADALLRLDEKADSQALARDRHWPIRVSEAAAALVKHDPQLVAELVKSPLFGRPGHIAFTGIPGFDRTAAARRFLSRAANDPDYAWQPQQVALLGDLPASEVGETLTMLWDRGGLEDELIPLFARNPTVCDHDKFIVGLRSTRANTIALAAKAMRKLPAAEDGSDLAALIQVLRMLPVNEMTVRNEVTATLRLRTGADLEADAQAWAKWIARNRPDVARKLSTGSANIAQTQKRLTGIDWSVGNVENGKKVFARASCAACHNGALAVGPSLEGVASRFSRDDLLTAIIEPNRDVSPRYRVTQVATDDGKVYQGIVIYEANDGLILQTGATETVRIAGPRVVSKKLLDSSLMPAGLLDPLSDQEIADLFAYIETLGKPEK